MYISLQRILLVISVLFLADSAVGIKNDECSDDLSVSHVSSTRSQPEGQLVNALKIEELVASCGVSTCLRVSIPIEAPAELVFSLVSDIRGNSLFFPTTEFRFDGTCPIKTGDQYFAREAGKQEWIKYQFIDVEENRLMSGELSEKNGMIKRMRYNHEILPISDGRCLSQETVEYQLACGCLGNLINLVA